ncbi:hypothetical protein F3Y22_tig00110229pilonHSYRG00017 [Hibiscus syriacus]|uniref:Integrase zinc-binding domain-containing protein n=1 Tax=Hibiscus syriacus TaxID=106335 RepID=A0A6A3BD83_HIBSY|nr:hypothetical protein F3Y22_tig00110229pilonHSYRG00017 [Hibiscus syriacus]
MEDDFQGLVDVVYAKLDHRQGFIYASVETLKDEMTDLVKQQMTTMAAKLKEKINDLERVDHLQCRHEEWKLKFQITNLSEEEGYSAFMNGLQRWAKMELQRRGVKELSQALVEGEAIVEFETWRSEPSKPKPRPTGNDISVAGLKLSALVDIGSLELFMSEQTAKILDLRVENARGIGYCNGKETIKVIQLDDFDFVIGFVKVVCKEKPTSLASPVVDEVTKVDQIPEEVRQVLAEFHDVMHLELQKSLPLKREVDHNIELVPNAEPPSRSLDEHLEHLRKVFEVLRENELYVKEEKCSTTEEGQGVGLGFEVPGSFDAIKQAMVGEPILVLPDFTKPFEIYTDALNIAIGGVLMQEGYLVAFEILKLNDIERRYSCHDSQWVGHPGMNQTLALLAEHYYWLHMGDDVEAYVKTCLVCQHDKIDMKKPVGLLQPLPILERPWESFSMDFIVGLQNTDGLSSIMVVVDRFSKYGTFISASKILDPVVQADGIRLEFLHDLSSTDGQTERVNSLVEIYLRHYSTNQSPFKIMAGQQPLAPNTIVAKYEGPNPATHKFAREWQEHVNLARACLHKVGKRTKKWEDRRCKDMNFEVGDLFLAKLINVLRNPNIHKGLVRRYEGPFRVLKRVCTMVYRLELAPTIRAHPVFHVSLLKPYHGDEGSPD